jgi:hypothetical protein
MDFLAIGCVPGVALLATGIILRDHIRSRQLRRRALQLGVKRACRRIGESFKEQFLALKDGGHSPRLFVHCEADEQRVRDFLTPFRLERLRSLIDHYRVTCSPEWGSIHRPGRKISPQALGQFLEETRKIAELLLACAPGVESASAGCSGILALSSLSS